MSAAGIAGAVGEKDAVGFQGEHVLGAWWCAGTTLHLEAVLAQAAQDVALQAVSRRRRCGASPAAVFRRPRRCAVATFGAVAFHDGPRAAELVLRVPVVSLLARDLLHEIRCRPSAAPSWRAATASLRRDVVGREAALHRAACAQVLGERAGVDALDAGDVAIASDSRRAISCERQLLATGLQFLDDEAAHVRLRAFVVEVVDAVVADQRIRSSPRSGRGRRDRSALPGSRSSRC